jgi:hypothetical protein
MTSRGELAKVLPAGYVGESRFAEKPMTLRALSIIPLWILVACSKKPEAAAAQDTLTRRERDSAIGASAIPGAQGVQKAMNAADTIDAHTAAIDSAGAEIQ